MSKKKSMAAAAVMTQRPLKKTNHGQLAVVRHAGGSGPVDRRV